MSAIQKELCKATGLEAPSKASERQEFLVDVLRKVGKLGDKDWDDLSKEAQNWFNEAADAKNAKKDELPDFPDLVEEEPTARRRRSSTDDEGEKASSGAKEIDPDDVKEKMAVRVLTKRGKEFNGHVSEVTDDLMVVKSGNGEEDEIPWKSVDKVFTLVEAKEEGTKRRRATDDEPATPVLKAGVEVKLVTKRGKEVTGKIEEITDELVVIDGTEYERDRVESITPVGGGKSESKEEGTKRRGSSEGKDEKEEGKRTRSSNPEGVSVGTRITEIILDDLDISEEDVGKKLKKEGIDFRENTLSLNYKSTKKFIELLKARKMLKA